MEEKKYGKCPECSAPCEITQGAYKEEMHDVHYVEHKYQPQPRASWVTGQYDRLYDQVKSGKRTVCYVDYYWDRDKSKEPCRDITTVRADYMDFGARGISYGGAAHIRIDENEKEEFISECERLNVEWLCESAPSGERDGDAVAFNIYCTDSYYYENGFWWHKENHDPYAVDQLYDIFKQQKENNENS